LQPAVRPDALGRIGHYHALQVLGKGGFGVVFRAFDDTLQRVVAVKMMAPQLAATSPARKRFLREARTSAQVRHENIVQVHEVGEQPLPYLVMEFIPGETLQQRLDRLGPVDTAEVVRVGRQIAEGLAAAHAMDLIHRDIKPGNILLEGAQLKVKITDFGLARSADDASLSQSGVIAGTPMFMAPEQAKGEQLDQRADLFSLGSVLYQMASGRPPFRANGTLAVLKRVAEDQPRDIREIIPETPQWLCDIIAKLHAKNPDERFQSAREVADLLADCEAQLKAHTKLKDSSRIPCRKMQRSEGRKWVAVAAVLLLPVIALVVSEFAGVTHLFRDRDATPNHPDGPPEPIAKGDPSRKDEPPKEQAELDHWVQRVAALPAEEQLEEVRKELVRRNPGFDGKFEHKIEDGVVTEFEIVTDNVTDIAPIRVWSALRVLESRGGMLLWDLTPLKGMNLATLTDLNLEHAHVTDAGLAPFKNCKNLRCLQLGGTREGVTDAGLAHFKDCKNLTKLELWVTGVTDAGLAHFKDCKNLTALSVAETGVSNAGLVHFKDCKNLTVLDIVCPRVSDAGLRQFKGIPLTVLKINKTGITDLTPVQGMPLEDIRLTPKNITRGLDILRDMKSLKTIGISWDKSWLAAEFWERYDKGEFKE
jgi:serine/threonine protein kinase